MKQIKDLLFSLLCGTTMLTFAFLANLWKANTRPLELFILCVIKVPTIKNNQDVKTVFGANVYHVFVNVFPLLKYNKKWGKP